jgi:CRP-like cAMP-binding protein
MPEDTSRSTTPNQLLSRLTRADFGLLEPHLEAVDLPLRKPLEPRNRRVEQVYFMESGIASVVANGGRDIEVGLIGREGMTGLSVVMCNDERAPHDTYMQVAGKGLRMRSGDLRGAIAASVALHHVFLRYAFTFMTQATQTAAANGRGKIEERLSRWLLMAHDRTDGNEFPLTHELLATMLGVRRAGVTVALQQLERVGLITHRRGVIAILDRKALEDRSNGTYFRPNDD